MKFVAYNDCGEIIGSVSTDGLKNLYKSSSHGDFDRLSFNQSVLSLAKKADKSEAGSHRNSSDLVGSIIAVIRDNQRLSANPAIHEVAQSAHAVVADRLSQCINALPVQDRTNEALHAKIRTLENDVRFYLNYDVDGLTEMAHDLIDGLETFVRNVTPNQD